MPVDRVVSVSRRDLQHPYYRVTRNTDWPVPINPWKEKDRLPLFEGGLIAKLIYGDEPQIIDNLDVPADDPAVEYLAGYGSLLAIPLFDQGVAQNRKCGAGADDVLNYLETGEQSFSRNDAFHSQALLRRFGEKKQWFILRLIGVNNHSFG